MRTLLGGEHSTLKTKQLLKERLRADYGFPTKGYDDDKIRRIINCFTWYVM